jgi:hypothetical protein
MNDERENKKWIDEYQTLKQVNAANPFVVPVNYFDEMGQQVMAQVNLDVFKNARPVNEFKIPENYFNQLEQNIQGRIAIDEVVNTNKGFTVPADYFNELEQNIQSRIAIDELLSSEESFTVPADYFNELEQNIQSRIAIDESARESFTIPEGYFETLENRILAQTTLAVETKDNRKEHQGVVIKLWASTAVKYAMAACLSVIVGTGILVSEFNTTGAAHNRNYVHKQLSKIPADEIETYLQLNSDAASIVDNTDMSDVDMKSVTNTKN